MEGVSSESCSLAGHHKLGNLTVFYDSNKITIEGSTDLAFTEDVLKRYEAYGWNTLSGNPYDFNELSSLVEKAKKEKNKPTIILLKTTIGKGAATMAGSHHSHGAPLGPEEIAATKKALGLPENEMFYIDPEAKKYFAEKIKELEKKYKEWNKLFDEWKKANPELHKEWQSYSDKISYDFSTIDLPKFQIGDKLATRAASGQTLNALAKKIPNLIGGFGRPGAVKQYKLKRYGRL